MLTIRAMAEMGPWTLDGIDVLAGRLENCKRCDTRIKNVWVMEKQTASKEKWRIGSECGPQLEDMCRELWATVTTPFRLSLQHFTKLARLSGFEGQFPQLTPKGYRLGWAAEQQMRLGAILTDHERRVMGSQVSRALTGWESSFANRRVTTSSPLQ